MRWLLLACLVSPAYGQFNSQPQYSLPGEKYEVEAPAINQMFQNVANDITYLKNQIDTKISTAPQSFAAQTVNASTFTAFGAGAVATFTNTVPNCVPGSTLTIVMSGGRMLIGFTGESSNATVDAIAGMGAMIDGSLTADGNSFPLNTNQPEVGGARYNASFTTLTHSTYTGSHTVCLAKYVNTGTGTVCDPSKCRLWIQEVR